MALRRKVIAGLRREFTDARRKLDQADMDFALARDGMMAVYQALAGRSGANRQIKAMVDKMAVMQCQFG